MNRKINEISKEELPILIFDYIRNFFYERTGNRISEDKRYLVLYRLSSLVGKGREYPDYETLRTIIQNDPYGETANHVITRLTTHYSYFFREPEHFSFFQRYLLNLPSDEKEIRVWSGACSTGEEAYSLAISSRLCLPEKTHQVKIIGTDISRDSVAIARTGIYSRGIVSSTLPVPLINEFFEHEGEQIRIKNDIRKMTRFAQLNLLEDYPFKKQFHVIFLRNIFYYLEPDKREAVLERILPVLKPKGFVILGNMDPSPARRFPLKAMGNNVFRKKRK